MERNLAVVLPVPNGAYRERILAAAERHGFRAGFFSNEREAAPALPEAEVILGQSAFLARNAR